MKEGTVKGWTRVEGREGWGRREGKGRRKG